MPRPKAPPRVTGPYAERDGTRFRIRILGEGSAKNLYFPTMDAALASKAQVEQQLKTPSHHRVGELIEEFFAERERAGMCRAQTLSNEHDRLRYFLAEQLELEIRTITPRRAEEIYRSAIERPSAKTGKPLEAASHRFYLGIAKRFFAWTTKQGFTQINPFQDVLPQGRPNVGKPQLRIDEANRFVATALRLHDEEGDVLALGAVVALLLGMSASEVLRRRVRDVDGGGKLFWLDGGIHRSARRDVTVPKVLQERLVSLAAGKESESLLFGSNSQGEPRHHRVLWSTVGRICELAQVPRVCTHSLRGLWATLSHESGALSEVVASSVGHGSLLMTTKHRVPPESERDMRTTRSLELVDAAQPDPASDDEQLAEQEAAQLLAKLPRMTREKLLHLVRRETESA